MHSPLTVGFLSRPRPIGGPGTFQVRLSRALERGGHRAIIVSDGKGQRPDVLLVIGGPVKALGNVIRWKLRGAKIVQRLAGPYWRHRAQRMPPSMRLLHMLRNRAMLFVRNQLADHVVYQSQFVRRWWHAEYGPAPCPECIIVNGVDLAEFTPLATGTTDARLVLLVVEGELHATTTAMEVLAAVPQELSASGVVQGTEVYGHIDPEARARLADIPGLELVGAVPRERMPRIFGRRGIYLNLEVNPSCPNAVLEALACGMPVVGFDTGALDELVAPEAGRVVPYGGDPWKLERPDVAALSDAIRAVADHLDDYRRTARARAERRFDLSTMTTAYVSLFERVLARA